VVLPDVDSRISNFALKTGSRSKTERNIVIHVEETIKVNNEVLLMIGIHGDCAICTFHIQRGSLSIWRSSCDLRMNFNEKMYTWALRVRSERENESP
jgi:hypothetical protein